MKNPYTHIKLLIEKRRIIKAIKELQTRLTAEPGNIYFLEYLSVCLRLKGKYEEAIETCKKGILLDPHYIPIQLELINSYIYSDKLALAGELLEKLVSKIGGSTQLSLAFGRYYLQIKNLQEAEKYLNLATQEEPGNAEAHFLKGVFWLARVEKSKAGLEFFQAYRLRKSAYYFVSMVESYLCYLGKWRGGIGVMLMLLSFFTPFPFVFYFILSFMVSVFWTFITGIILGDRRKIKASILLLLIYPLLLYFFQKMTTSFWR